MKAKFVFLAMLVLMLALGFVSCDNGSTGSVDNGPMKFEGSWAGLNSTYKFEGDTVLYTDFQGRSRPGTFTFTNNQITFIPPPGTWTGYTHNYKFIDNRSLELTGSDDFTSGIFFRYPAITDLALITYEDWNAMNWNPQASFPKSSRLCLGIHIRALDEEITQYIIVFKNKKSGKVLSTHTREHKRETQLDRNNYRIYSASWTIDKFTVGSDYTVEVYAVGENGTKSNTMARDFKLTEG